MISRPIKDLKSKGGWEEKSAKTNVTELVVAEVEVGEGGAGGGQLAKQLM